MLVEDALDRGNDVPLVQLVGLDRALIEGEVVGRDEVRDAFVHRSAHGLLRAQAVGEVRVPPRQHCTAHLRQLCLVFGTRTLHGRVELGLVFMEVGVLLHVSVEVMLRQAGVVIRRPLRIVVFLF